MTYEEIKNARAAITLYTLADVVKAVVRRTNKCLEAKGLTLSTSCNCKCQRSLELTL